MKPLLFVGIALLGYCSGFALYSSFLLLASVSTGVSTGGGHRLCRRHAICGEHEQEYGGDEKYEYDEVGTAIREGITEEGVEYAGDVVVPGKPHGSLQDCAEACYHTPHCNTYVFCARDSGCNDGRVDSGECWLKHIDVPETPRPPRMSTNKGWSSGIVLREEDRRLLEVRRYEEAREKLRELDEKGEGLDIGTVRACGSPASDAYATVNATCLLESPTAKLYRRKKFESVLAESEGSGSLWSYKDSRGCVVEEFTSYDGIGLVWGPDNKVESAEDCCEACMNHERGAGPFADLPCNVWVFCPHPTCFEPDAHVHTQGDCWLKFSELPHRPEVNQRGHMTYRYRERHNLNRLFDGEPFTTEWTSGVLLVEGLTLTNGTWSPRAEW